MIEMRKPNNYTWVECPYCSHNYWLDDVWFDESKEQIEKHKKMFCPNSKGHIKILQDERFNSVNIEQRQEIIDLIKTGTSIGEVSKLLNLNTDVVAEVLYRNIKSVSFLRTETI